MLLLLLLSSSFCYSIARLEFYVHFLLALCNKTGLFATSQQPNDSLACGLNQLFNLKCLSDFQDCVPNFCFLSWLHLSPEYGGRIFWLKLVNKMEQTWKGIWWQSWKSKTAIWSKDLFVIFEFFFFFLNILSVIVY